MDKSWMSMDRRSDEYENGVDRFCEFALHHAADPSSIRCPCLECGHVKPQTIKEVRSHLLCYGIDQSYVTWYWDGEPILSSDQLIKDEIWESYNERNLMENTVEMVEAARDEYVSNPEAFEKLLEDAEKPIYPGCVKFTKLSTLVRLYNLKAQGGWPNKSFSALLKFLGELLPQMNEMPSTLYAAKKTLGSLGMEYEKIHACPNDCILYRKEYSEASVCPSCGVSRWKVSKNSNEVQKKQIPAKVMWYFPPIPRFRRMFRNRDTAKNLIWHATEREEDGKLRHPADSPSWKLVDHMWPDFGDDPRNLRLAISADGINPHGCLSSRYSCWPVLMVTYNLPPWMCLKRKFIMLTMLISGPKQPGNDIDVYLAPLVDDLKTLWDVGVKAYDAYTQETFMLKAILLWTINDFPAYGNLCGCSVKGYKVCPICGDNTHSEWLKFGNKVSFVGHRKYLPSDHVFRKQKGPFNGQQEFGIAPDPLSGKEILERVKGIKPSWGKKLLNYEKPKVKVQLGKRKARDGVNVKKKKLVNDLLTTCWKKKSIFFDLPYWSSLHVRHCLDVMHIEKNVCESLIGTLLNIPGKSKDSVAARKDLVEKGLRKGLAPKEGKKKTYLPAAPYTLSKKEKQSVCGSLYGFKGPKNFSSNFKNLVSMQELKLFGRKSHDCHILMQHLIPVAIRAVLPKHVRYAITRFCVFFNALCSKTIDVLQLDEIQSGLVETLCLLEKIFPPSFFDIMVHLTVHLIREVRLCGPVYLHWMYPFERYMSVLKDYVRNRNRPEGCMAEAYIAEEAVDFCADYLSGVHAVGLPPKAFLDLKDYNAPLGSGHVVTACPKLRHQAHLSVLDNTAEVRPYIDEHLETLKLEHPQKSKSEKWLRDEHNRRFSNWLQQRVELELNSPENEISESLRWLAHGPRYTVNGSDYHTKDIHGVTLNADALLVSSAKDRNPEHDEMTFYGVIQEIWELNYNTFTRLMFKCDWVANSKKGIKVEDFGFTLVDLSRIGHKSDSFVLADLVQKVFYIEDPADPRWSVVLQASQLDWLNEDELGDTTLDHQSFPHALPSVSTFDIMTENDADYVRTDCEGTWVEEHN
ncbi:uncharacterized protein LOC112178311 [Rosa chinensis]|uniref:uncharacterized protein LOC112178311 n=1 Tax=Rosa chinensis TaxID=74649 RepID=UPI000D08C809|nr:uncharacterized protein LOC112178311 [Rosa chinensis]